MQYKSLSKYYEKLILDDGYDKWTDYMLSLVKSKLKLGVGYDVGCGTGIFTRKLKKSGFSVKGVDISQEMLGVAKDLSARDNVYIDYLQCDMRALKSFEKLDFITIVNDGLNYVMQKDIKRCFSSFSKCLKKGGILLFDISTEYKLSSVLNGNMFGSDDEDLSYVWLSEYDNEDKKLIMNLSFFEKQGELYKRYDEQQTEYAHQILDIKSELESAGFELVSISGAFGEELNEKSHRAVFLAIKK